MFIGAYASIANPLGLPGGLPVEVALGGGQPPGLRAVVLLTVPIAAVSLAVRFRRARGLECQQLRWLAFAAGLASVGAVLALAGTPLPTSTATTLALITWGAGLCLALLPLAIGAAILRSRLLPGPDQQPHGRLRAAHAAGRGQPDRAATRASLCLRPQGAAGATDGTAAHRFLIRR
jgi:hypothetical protein